MHSPPARCKEGSSFSRASQASRAPLFAIPRSDRFSDLGTEHLPKQVRFFLRKLCAASYSLILVRQMWWQQDPANAELLDLPEICPPLCTSTLKNLGARIGVPEQEMKGRVHLLREAGLVRWLNRSLEYGWKNGRRVRMWMPRRVTEHLPHDIDGRFVLPLSAIEWAERCAAVKARHGGRRAGAGRKPKSPKVEGVSMSEEPLGSAGRGVPTVGGGRVLASRSQASSGRPEEAPVHQLCDPLLGVVLEDRGCGAAVEHPGELVLPVPLHEVGGQGRPEMGDGDTPHCSSLGAVGGGLGADLMRRAHARKLEEGRGRQADIMERCRRKECPEDVGEPTGSEIKTVRRSVTFRETEREDFFQKSSSAMRARTFLDGRAPRQDDPSKSLVLGSPSGSSSGDRAWWDDQVWERVVPRFPGIGVVPLAVVPAPRKLREPDPVRAAKILAAVYRGAVERFWPGRPCFVLARGDVSKSRYFKLLVSAAETLRENGERCSEMSPAAWVAFSCEAWRAMGKSGGPPPLSFVFSAFRLAERWGWFEADFLGRYEGSRVVVGPLHRRLMEDWRAMSASIVAERPKDRLALGHVVERFFPGRSWEDRVRAVGREAAASQAAIDQAIARGAYPWS